MKSVTEGQSIEIVPFASIVADSEFNGRKKITETGETALLAEDIKKNGLNHPLTVTKRGKKYYLIAGFRRHAAITSLAWPKVVVTIVPDDDLKNRVLNIAENVGREDLTPLELGKAALEIQKRHKLSGAQVAEEIGYKKAYVNECIAYAKLPAEITSAVELGAKKMPQKLLKKLLYECQNDSERLTAWRAHIEGKEPPAGGDGAKKNRPSKSAVTEMIEEIDVWKKADPDKYTPDFLAGARAALSWAAGTRQRPPVAAAPAIDDDDDDDEAEAAE